MEEKQQEPEVIGASPERAITNTIEGSIKYTIKEFDNGGWEVEYESSTDNDLAVIAIAQDLTEIIVAQLSVNKSQTDSKIIRKHLNKIIGKGVSARTGLKALADYLQPLFSEYKKSLAKEQANEENKGG